MMKKLSHKFVKHIPEAIEEAILFISVEFATVIHKCCCGCGEEVVTPISPVDWQLTFDGKSISLYPSIGNWSFKCRSHYWIRNNTVVWAPKWSEERIKARREEDYLDKKRFYKSKKNLSKDK